MLLRAGVFLHQKRVLKRDKSKTQSYHILGAEEDLSSFKRKKKGRRVLMNTNGRYTRCQGSVWIF